MQKSFEPEEEIFNAVMYLCFMAAQPSNPLHGKTLEAIITELVAYYGWERLGKQISINCFTKDPSIKSSLKFLRKTEWARKKVEELYLDTPFT